MKKIVFALALVAGMALISGCGSLRTPKSGPRADQTYYNTFFGLSIESALWGDGIIPGSDIN